VSLIAAEDTRHTRKLLSAYDIHTPLVSYHEHNKFVRIEPMLEALQLGPVALVSDAGTPALNDPGYELVRAAIDEGHTVTPIPGPAAPVAALVASGLPTDQFVYLGYLPRRGTERREQIQQVSQLPYTLIFLETPHRLVESLEDLYRELGDRPIAVARELTKMHEEIYRSTLAEAIHHFQENEPRGEFTLVISGWVTTDHAWTEEHLEEAIREGISQGEPAKALAQRLAADSSLPRREIYSRILRIKNESL
jgi:16S rRNA (cytidine1402-2'-O)-methyltransferase